MTTRTVKVPAAMEPIFARAEEVVSRYFRERTDSPELGQIEIFGERYLLVRAASLSVEFFDLVRGLYGEGRTAEADAFTRNILFDLAHAIGRADARNFHAKMGLTDPIARLSAGPVHFSHSGWAFVDIFPESRPAPDDTFFLLYEHPYSFESDAWGKLNKGTSFPVCIMNAGYSSGWCEESFGVQLVASEVLCRAKGDPCCRFVMAHPNRIETYVRDHIAQSPDLGGRMEGFQIPDFFARKRVEEGLRRMNEELEARVNARTAEVSQANELLRAEMAQREGIEKRLLQGQKLEALGRLAGGVAHDFNNLLAVVVTQSSRIQRMLPAADPLQSELQLILDAGYRAADLTRGLLAFGRAQRLQKQVLEVNGVAAAVARLVAPLLGEQLRLETRLHDDAGNIETDRGQLEQVLVNLLINARDSMSQAGAVVLETRACELDSKEEAQELDLPLGPYVQVRVVDTGVGMSEEIVGHLFEPFFTTKPYGAGSGLGLSTAYGIARQSGGTLVASSQPGEGSVFTLWLPRVAASVTQEKPRAPEPVTTRGGGETVLLVEDQKAVRLTTRLLLVDLGYRVLEAEDPAAALALVDHHPAPIDVVVSDVVMPGMNGVVLAQRLKALRPQIRVLLVSGYPADALRVGVTPPPFDGFLEKPFKLEQLALSIREVLGR